MTASRLTSPENLANAQKILETQIIFKEDNTLALRKLLASGFDINITALQSQSIYNPKDFKGPYQISLLSFAIEENALGCLQELVGQGIEINRSDTFEAAAGSALMYVLNYHSANEPQDTIARVRNYTPIIKILLQVPLDTDLTNMYQENIFDLFKSLRDPEIKELVLKNILAQQKTPEEWYKPLVSLIKPMLQNRQENFLQQIVDNFYDTTILKQVSLILDLNSQGFSQEIADKFNQQVIQKIKALEDKSLLNSAITTRDFEEKLNAYVEKEKKVFKV